MKFITVPIIIVNPSRLNTAVRNLVLTTVEDIMKNSINNSNKRNIAIMIDPEPGLLSVRYMTNVSIKNNQRYIIKKEIMYS
ncbi:hypothetical protein JXI42_03930 [bacterium]|nr:hypothetical protein [bacterium]